MPKRKERAAGYIRESDPTLADSATIDSQAKVVRAYCQKEGYDYNIADHEYKEAISAYVVSYTQRPKLMEMLKAAKRKEFDVLVLSEIRALSRKQVEVFVVYDMLQKYGVRIETTQEKFEDSAIGRYILATRAMIAEAERENTYMRMERGKRDRREAGNLNGSCKPTYGYVYIDTEREVKARYALNTTIIYVDAEGTEWSEYKVVVFIFELALSGESLRSIAFTLTDIGIPIPKNGKSRKGKQFSGTWWPSTVNRILSNPMYTGRAVCNKYMTVKGKIVKRPEQEQLHLPDGVAPAIVSQEVFEKVQEQLKVNKRDSLRNNNAPKEELGILRAGYARCGICNGSMAVRRRGEVSARNRKPEYACCKNTGKDDLIHKHCTNIALHILDRQAWEKALLVIRNPQWVRARVAELREENKPVVNVADVEATIENIKRQMKNLYTLAQNSTDDETLEQVTAMLHDLERQKHKAQGLLYDLEEDEEERAEVEAEIVKFEKWVEKVQPLLTDPGYTPSYEEQRLAVRILGIRAIVFPASGGHPFRTRIDVTIPSIVSKMKYCVANDQSLALKGSLGSVEDATPAVLFQSLMSEAIPTPIL